MVKTDTTDASWPSSTVSSMAQIPNEQTPAGGMLWGFPEMLEVDDLPLMRNRLAEPEKNFKTLAEAQADWEAFRAAPNPDFSEFCNDIFGDG